MTEIIIYNQVRDRAFDNDLENLILFGEKNYIDDTNKVYDLIFHSKQINPYSFKKPTSLVIPVIRTFNEKQAIETIYDINKQFPDFDRFAVSGEFLDFYKIVGKDSKKEIERLGKYDVVNETELKKYSKDHFFEQKINKKIIQIEDNYQTDNQ